MTAEDAKREIRVSDHDVVAYGVDKQNRILRYFFQGGKVVRTVDYENREDFDHFGVDIFDPVEKFIHRLHPGLVSIAESKSWDSILRKR